MTDENYVDVSVTDEDGRHIHVKISKELIEELKKNPYNNDGFEEIKKVLTKEFEKE